MRMPCEPKHQHAKPTHPTRRFGRTAPRFAHATTEPGERSFRRHTPREATVSVVGTLYARYLNGSTKPSTWSLERFACGVPGYRHTMGVRTQCFLWVCFMNRVRSPDSKSSIFFALVYSILAHLIDCPSTQSKGHDSR